MYPPDDDQERLRWSGWGNRVYFLWVKGEPVVIKGEFDWGYSKAELVSWLAPDGAQRALCYLRVDSGKPPRREIVRNENPALCGALKSGSVQFVSWSSEPVAEKIIDDYGHTSIPERTTAIDINADGKTEKIGQFLYESSAGCGGSSQWLQELVPESSSASLKEVLNGGITRGPIKNVGSGDPWSSVNIFLFQKKPYILEAGEESSAAVTSVWGGKKETWCEYNILPQYEVDVFYPVESWP